MRLEFRSRHGDMTESGLGELRLTEAGLRYQLVDESGAEIARDECLVLLEYEFSIVCVAGHAAGEAISNHGLGRASVKR